MIANNAEIALRLVKKLARRLDSADEMIQILLNPDPQARVLLGAQAPRRGLRRGDGRQGVRVHASADDLAREVGVDGAQVRDVLARLAPPAHRRPRTRRARIVVADSPRLLEFLEFLEMPRKFEG